MKGFREFSLNRFTISTKFPCFLIDYSYFYTRIVISYGQRLVKPLNFQYNIKITTQFKSKRLKPCDFLFCCPYRILFKKLTVHTLEFFKVISK